MIKSWIEERRCNMHTEDYENSPSLSLTAEEKRKIGDNLRRVREEHHLSQEALSEIMDCTPQYVSDVERGKYSFSLKKIIVLCDYFGIPSDRLIYGTQENYTPYDKRTRILRKIEDLSVDELNLLEEGIDVMKRMLEKR